MASTPATSLSITQHIISDLSALPPNLTSLEIYASRFAYNGSADQGLSVDSSIVWDKLWNQCLFLQQLTIVRSNIGGSLPAALPSQLFYLSLPENGIKGEIPPGILASILPSSTTTGNPRTLTLFLENNQITGSIPENMFSGYAGGLGGLRIVLAANLLNGSITSSLFADFQDAAFPFSFIVNLASNSLTGSIPAQLIPSGMLSSATSFSLSLASNQLSGAIDNNAFANVDAFWEFELDLQNNVGLTSLPSRLFSADGWIPGNSAKLAIDISDCGLAGSISDTFLTAGLSGNVSLSSLTLDLSHNSLTGSIPETLLRHFLNPYSIQPQTTVITLASNELTGSLPDDAFRFADIDALTIDIRNNPSISGTIPEALFQPLLSARSLTFIADETALSGSPPRYCSSTATRYYFNNAALSGTIPETWSTECGLTSLEISNNFNFRSSIPPGLLNKAGFASFLATNTPLQGTLPEVGQNMVTLNLDGTKIDLCNINNARNTTVIPASIITCSLQNTVACQCPERFPNKCTLSECSGFPAPVVAAPSGCPLNTRPSVDFECVNGLWTAASANTPTLNIPSGAGTVVIVGNLTSSTLIFHGVGSTININGSVGGLTTITLEFDSNQASNLGGQKVLQILVNTSGSNSSTDLSLVNVNTKVTSGCRKVKSEKATFDGGKTLGVYLSVDSSGCNTWWIILVSVVVAVIVIAAVVLVLLAVFYEPFRLKIRPYSGGRKADAERSNLK